MKEGKQKLDCNLIAMNYCDVSHVLRYFAKRFKFDEKISCLSRERKKKYRNNNCNPFKVTVKL